MYATAVAAEQHQSTKPPTCQQPTGRAQHNSIGIHACGVKGMLKAHVTACRCHLPARIGAQKTRPQIRDFAGSSVHLNPEHCDLVAGTLAGSTNPPNQL
jgi:hypothetical protein